MAAQYHGGFSEGPLSAISPYGCTLLRVAVFPDGGRGMD
jgi:hypothetical protein